MPNKDQLTAVVTAFEHWRSNKNGRRVPTPKPLRKQAVSLLENYSPGQITTALRISGTQLKQWGNSSKLSEQIPQFIELPVSSVTHHDPFNVELSFVSGDQLRLCGIYDPNLLTTLIGAMKS